MLDEEMEELISETINVDVPYLFFSSVAQKGLTELKDELWKMMQIQIIMIYSDQNKQSIK